MQYQNLYGTERISPPRATSPSKSYYPPGSQISAYPSYNTRAPISSYSPRKSFNTNYHQRSIYESPSLHSSLRFDKPSFSPVTRSQVKPILKKDKLEQTDLTIEITGADTLSEDEVQTLLYLLIKNKLRDDNFVVDHLYDHSYLVTFDLLEDAQYILDEYDRKTFDEMMIKVYF